MNRLGRKYPLSWCLRCRRGLWRQTDRCAECNEKWSKSPVVHVPSVFPMTGPVALYQRWSQVISKAIYNTKNKNIKNTSTSTQTLKTKRLKTILGHQEKTHQTTYGSIPSHAQLGALGCELRRFHLRGLHRGESEEKGKSNLNEGLVANVSFWMFFVWICWMLLV